MSCVPLPTPTCCRPPAVPRLPLVAFEVGCAWALGGFPSVFAGIFGCVGQKALKSVFQSHSCQEASPALPCVGPALGRAPPGSQVRGRSASPQPKPGTPPRYGRDLPGWQPQPLPHTWPPCLPGRSEVSLRAWGPAWHSSQRSPGTRELSTRWGLRPCAGRGHPGPAESPQPCHCSLFSSGPRVWAFPGAPQASPGTPRFPPVM